MHDYLEGIREFDMTAMIKLYISKDYFSLNELNNRMVRFEWENSELENTPPEILDRYLQHDSLRMSASERLAFVRYFGVLVGDVLSENDSSCEIYLIIRRILGIVLSSSIQSDCLICLQNFI